MLKIDEMMGLAMTERNLLRKKHVHLLDVLMGYVAFDGDSQS